MLGYMRKLGPATLGAFRNRILNIHSALPPDMGGKDRYGIHVHESVLASGDSELVKSTTRAPSLHSVGWPCSRARQQRFKPVYGSASMSSWSKRFYDHNGIEPFDLSAMVSAISQPCHACVGSC